MLPFLINLCNIMPDEQLIYKKWCLSDVLIIYPKPDTAVGTLRDKAHLHQCPSVMIKGTEVVVDAVVIQTPG